MVRWIAALAPWSTGGIGIRHTPDNTIQAKIVSRSMAVHRYRQPGAKVHRVALDRIEALRVRFLP